MQFVSRSHFRVKYNKYNTALKITHKNAVISIHVGFGYSLVLRKCWFEKISRKVYHKYTRTSTTSSVSISQQVVRMPVYYRHFDYYWPNNFSYSAAVDCNTRGDASAIIVKHVPNISILLHRTEKCWWWIEQSLEHWFSTSFWEQKAAPKHPLCGPRQSFNRTSNVMCNKHRSAIKQNVSIDLRQIFLSAAL